MIQQNSSNSKNIVSNDLEILKKILFDECGFSFSNLKIHTESQEYGACTFELDKRKIEFRISKITPKKVGQFVTIWKRNAQGITEPFSISDDFDFFVIASIKEEKLGVFVFPKSILAQKGIITNKEIDGKRGIRVYPTWDITENKSAKMTQNWQKDYFIELTMEDSINLELVKRLFQNN